MKKVQHSTFNVQRSRLRKDRLKGKTGSRFRGSRLKNRLLDRRLKVKKSLRCWSGYAAGSVKFSSEIF